MNPALKAMVLAAGAAWLAASVAQAQTSSAPPPPRSGATPVRPAVAPATPPAPRRAIELTPAEREAIDAALSPSPKPARVEDALAPSAEDIRPRAADDHATTQIEQRRVSNRVSEVVVTPSGQSRGYVMTNREGRQPFGTTQMNSGLSVPMFRFEFGRTTPPAANPPPPPAPSPSR